MTIKTSASTETATTAYQLPRSSRKGGNVKRTAEDKVTDTEVETDTNTLEFRSPLPSDTLEFRSPLPPDTLEFRSPLPSDTLEFRSPLPPDVKHKRRKATKNEDGSRSASQPNSSLQTNDGSSERDPKNHYYNCMCCNKVSLLEQSVLKLSGQVDFLLSYLDITHTHVQPNKVENRETSTDIGADVEAGLNIPG